MSRTDRSVVRNQPYRKSSISIRERHNERKNEVYSNPDIMNERSELNVHFKKCEGMNQTYTQGYMPIVSGGKASIVLPLISDIPLENNRINVSLGLGDTSSAPFVYNSYNRDFSLEDYAVDDGADTVSAYLVSFELPLKSARVNGVYPVTATITAKTADGNPIS